MMDRPRDNPIATSRGARPPSRSRGCLLVVGAILLLALGHLGRFLHDRDLARADLARRAPVVVADPVESCALSPGGRYLWLVQAGDRESNGFVDTASNTLIHLPPAQVPSVYGAWVGDTTLLLASRATTINPGRGTEYARPEDGWLLDMPARTVTPLAALPPADRASTLAVADERLRTQRERDGRERRSPDGQYIAIGEVITDLAGTVRNEPTGGAGSHPCLDGWRPDGTGLYYIEQTRVGLRGGGPGPVRLLLAEPPPPAGSWWQPAPATPTPWELR